MKSIKKVVILTLICSVCFLFTGCKTEDVSANKKIIVNLNSSKEISEDCYNSVYRSIEYLLEAREKFVTVDEILGAASSILKTYNYSVKCKCTQDGDSSFVLTIGEGLGKSESCFVICL